MEKFTKYITLEEGKKDYLNYLGKYAQNEDVKQALEWAIEVLKKSDRIMWYLRFVKLNQLKEHSPEAYAKEIEKLKKSTEKDFLIKNNNLYYYTFKVFERFVNFDENIRAKLEHHFNRDEIINAIDDYVFKFQTPSNVFGELDELEREYLDSITDSGTLIPDEESFENIIEFPDGYVWQDIGKAYCSDEARAMGHCGNVEGKSNRSQRILSLRKKVTKLGKVYWQPHLTFVLNSDGRLGEMKGKQNEKPNEKYHKYIIELLKNDIIEGIASGYGYLPQNNFSLADLEPDAIEDLMKQKPDLANLEAMISMYGEDDQQVKDRITEILGKHDTVEVDGKLYLQLDAEPGVSYLVSDWPRELENIPDILSEHSEDTPAEFLKEMITIDDLPEEYINILNDIYINSSNVEKSFATDPDVIKYFEKEHWPEYEEALNQMKVIFFSYAERQHGYYYSRTDPEQEPIYASLAVQMGDKVQFLRGEEDYIKAYDSGERFYWVSTESYGETALAIDLENGADFEHNADYDSYYDSDLDYSKDAIEKMVNLFDDEAIYNMTIELIKEVAGLTFYDDERQLKLFDGKNPFKEFKRYIAENNDLPKIKVTYKGISFETGKPVTFPYLKNTEKAPYFGKRFQQDIEPSGNYFIFDEDPKSPLPTEKWKRGEITLKNPMVMPLNLEPTGPIYNDKSWKQLLFNQYGAEGKELTKKLTKDGFDGIVTVDLKDHTISEIVKLK